MWIAFTVLAILFFIIFLLSVFIEDRPVPPQVSRGFDPLRPVKDWSTRQAIKHVQQEQAWQNVQADFERTELNIGRSHELSDQQHQITVRNNQLTMAQQDIAKADIDQAKAEHTDVATIQERRRLELAHEMEMKKLRESNDEEIYKHAELKRIDVQAYAQEVKVDLEAALTKRILDHKTVRRIEAEFQELVKERAEIEMDDSLTPHSKQLALDAKDELIAAFRKNLNEQMERRLLQAGNGADVQGMDAGS